MVVGKESIQTKEHPLFIPPRKRMTSKKTNGNQHHVDHIVNAQVAINNRKV